MRAQIFQDSVADLVRLAHWLQPATVLVVTLSFIDQLGESMMGKHVAGDYIGEQRALTSFEEAKSIAMNTL